MHVCAMVNHEEDSGRHDAGEDEEARLDGNYDNNLQLVSFTLKPW